MIGGSPETDEAYEQSLAPALGIAEEIGQADIVIGIPFGSGDDGVGYVERTVARGLSESCSDRSCVVACVGSHDAGGLLDEIGRAPAQGNVRTLSFLMKNELVSPKIRKIRAIMELAHRLNSDVAFFEPSLQGRESGGRLEGLTPEWGGRLLAPITKEGMDLVLPKFNGDYLGSPASAHLTRPLLTSIFGIGISGSPGDAVGVSGKLTRAHLANPTIWSDLIGDHGVYPWLVITAAAAEARMCESRLGVRLGPSFLENDALWSEGARVLFEAVARGKDWWQGRRDVILRLPVFGDWRDVWPEEAVPEAAALIDRFKAGFNEFEGLYQEILSREAAVELRKLAGSDPEAFDFRAALWAEVVHDFILCYCLEEEFAKDNLLRAFIPLCCGRTAGFAQQLRRLEGALSEAVPAEARRLTLLLAERELDLQTEEFIRQKPDFAERWDRREAFIQPLLPRVTYREFIPGVPLIVPKELTSLSDETISADGVYNAIVRRYHDEFERFVRDRLDAPRDATSADIGRRTEALMLRVEKHLGEVLLPEDITSLEGARKLVEAVLGSFPHSQTFALRPEVSSWILHRNPPSNLLIKSGASSLSEVEQRYRPNDLLALSGLTEETEHTARVWEWISGNARPEHFVRQAVEPVVESHEGFPALAQLQEPSALSKLAGTVVVSNLRAGTGGEFPKLRYLLTIAKNTLEAEILGEIWEQFARERKEFGTRVVNSLRGHWGRDPLSAHDMFENKVQRILTGRIRQMAEELDATGDASRARLAESLRIMADCYHLTWSAPDGSFIPFSAWTWASYSFKGGKGIPSALSLHVERDWSSREFLVGLLTALGGSEEDMDRKIVDLMGHGRESENLARQVLPGWQPVQEVMPEQLPRLAEPEAGRLARFSGNPVLKAIPAHEWESKYVFNPGAIWLDGAVYIAYRACGENEVSHIGLAVTADGTHIDERLAAPMFGPEEEWEKKGCEDPRLTLIDERLYMLYTAYSSVAAQVALASIDLDDFLNRRWDRWKRHGLAFPNFEDKDATLFPEKFDGRFIMYHRIEPSIWISASEYLDCPWPREDHRILVGPGAGMSWDGSKIGGGSQPIKTRHGWLLFYHGVDQSFVYRLGVLLVALDDPGRVLYRSPNPVLEPEESYERGEPGSYVPNVVFTCGAVPGENKDTLDDDDEVIVYYGAADTVACAARAKVSALIPEDVRQGRNHVSFQP